jgi:hypothetical protein
MSDHQLTIDMHETPETGNLRRNAERWIEEHPEVMALFERFALELAQKCRPFGMKLIAERVRWEIYFQYGADDRWKINNNYTAYIARRLANRHPSLRIWLRFRQTNF